MFVLKQLHILQISVFHEEGKLFTTLQFFLNIIIITLQGFDTLS